MKPLRQDIWSSNSDLNLGPTKYKAGVLTICTKPEIKIDMQGIHDTLYVVQVLVATIHEPSGNTNGRAGTILLLNLKEVPVISVGVQLQELILMIHATDINSIKICTTMVQINKQNKKIWNYFCKLTI